MADGKSGESEPIERAIERGGKTARIASSVLVAKTFTFVATGIAFILVARILGPGTYGIYTLAVAAAGIIGAFGDFGFSYTTVKFVSEYLEKKEPAKARATILGSYAWVVVLAGISTAIAFAMAGYIAQVVLHNPADTVVVEVAAFTIVTAALWNVSYSALVGIGKGRKITYAVAVQSSVQALASVSLALLGFGATAPLYGLVFGFFAGFLFAAAIETAAPGMKGRISKTVIEWKKLLNFAMPLGASNLIGGLVSNFATIYLGLFASAFVLGNFGITSRVSGMFDVIVGAIGFSLLPLFSATLSNKKATRNIGRYFNSSIHFSLLLVAPLILYIIALAVPFSFTVFGGVYTLAPLYIAIMCVGVLLSIISSYTGSLLVSSGKVRTFFAYNAVSAAILLVLVLLFVPIYTGLALIVITFLAIPALNSALYLNKVQKMFRMKVDYGKFARVIAASVASALFIVPLIFIFGGYTIALLVAAAIEQILIYPLVASKFGAIDKNTIEVLGRVTNAIPIIGAIMRLLIMYTNLFLR